MLNLLAPGSFVHNGEVCNTKGAIGFSPEIHEPWRNLKCMLVVVVSSLDVTACLVLYLAQVKVHRAFEISNFPLLVSSPHTLRPL